MTTSYYSTVLQHPADRVWAALRDFNGLATWFSGAVSESHIEDGLSGLTIGAVRSFQMGDSRIRERLRALSDIDRSYSYEFCEPAPFPVTGYLATVKVTPVSDAGHALVEWWADFDCALMSEGTGRILRRGGVRARARRATRVLRLTVLHQKIRSDQSTPDGRRRPGLG